MTRSDPRSSAALVKPALAALAAAIVVLIVLVLLLPGSSPPAPPVTAPTWLAPERANLAQGQAAAQRFAQTFAAYLNGTREVSDLRAAGLSGEIARSIEKTPSRTTDEDPPGHFAAQDVQVRPRGAELELLATFVDDDVRVPLNATMTRRGAAWKVTNFFAGGAD